MSQLNLVVGYSSSRKEDPQVVYLGLDGDKASQLLNQAASTGQHYLAEWMKPTSGVRRFASAEDLAEFQSASEELDALDITLQQRLEQLNLDLVAKVKLAEDLQQQLDEANAKATAKEQLADILQQQLDEAVANAAEKDRDASELLHQLAAAETAIATLTSQNQNSSQPSGGESSADNTGTLQLDSPSTEAPAEQGGNKSGSSKRAPK